MLPKSLLLIGASGTACMGFTLDTAFKGPSCATTPLMPAEKQVARVAMAENKASALQARMTGEIIQVPTYFHVVAKSKSVKDGYLSVGTAHPDTKIREVC